MTRSRSTPGTSPFAGESLLLVTGRLAEPALRRLTEQWQSQLGIELTLQVLPITVAALMTPEWIAKHLDVPQHCDRIILPGYCAGDLQPLHAVTDRPISIGPRELRQLPAFLGSHPEPPDLDQWRIEILAEINHAPQLTLPQLIAAAESLQADGADVIDIGCDPGSVWKEVGLAVRELVDRGLRVSIDSLQPAEIGPAVEAGASLVLSVNSTNRRAAVDWGCEVVAIPDSPADWLQVADTVDYLATRGVPLRIDPILEPVGLGFAASLARYLEARRIWPDARFLMGIGNLTELSDVDSAGINFLLLAICEELGIDSVLTTEVINWARSSVRECDIARRLVHFAVQQQVPPKNLDPRLVCLRDPQVISRDVSEIAELATQIRDNNYRILNADGEVHLLGGGKHWRSEDVFELFHQLMQSGPTNVDPSHAFYLGYEMCKATVALQLGKNYEQDQSLQWGHLTTPEIGHRRLQRGRRSSSPPASP